ncbi:PLDc N-terminal domain-containing protein [Microbacterium sp. A8/3-1]|uniref:PLDc N-terminal domain-containing protein n=1 Tax=Microbacterium sp. A8/3-1 TaxID=3160749 RepID=A0AAU7VS09_9MICO
MNPLIPGPTDVAWSVVWIAAVALAVVALVTLFRTKAAVGVAAATLWAFGIILIPVIGASVWLMASRRLRRAETRRKAAASGSEAA